MLTWAAVDPDRTVAIGRVQPDQITGSGLQRLDKPVPPRSRRPNSAPSIVSTSVSGPGKRCPVGRCVRRLTGPSPLTRRVRALGLGSSGQALELAAFCRSHSRGSSVLRSPAPYQVGLQAQDLLGANSSSNSEMKRLFSAAFEEADHVEEVVKRQSH